MKDQDWLIFIEVKCTKTVLINPLFKITQRKKRAMLYSADWYRVQHNYRGSYRFDAFVIYAKSDFEHIQHIVMA